jgi:hypothetical protein
MVASALVVQVLHSTRTSYSLATNDGRVRVLVLEVIQRRLRLGLP